MKFSIELFSYSYYFRANCKHGISKTAGHKRITIMYCVTPINVYITVITTTGNIFTMTLIRVPR